MRDLRDAAALLRLNEFYAELELSLIASAAVPDWKKAAIARGMTCESDVQSTVDLRQLGDAPPEDLSSSGGISV